MKTKKNLLLISSTFLLFFLTTSVSAWVRFASIDSCIGLTSKGIIKHIIGSKLNGWEDASLLGLADPTYEYSKVAIGDDKELWSLAVDQDFIYDAEDAINCMNTTGDYIFTRLQGVESPVDFALGNINQMSLISSDDHHYEVQKNFFAVRPIEIFGWIDKGYAPLSSIGRGKDGFLYGVASTATTGMIVDRVSQYDPYYESWTVLPIDGITNFYGFDKVFVGEEFQVLATAFTSPAKIATVPYKWYEYDAVWEALSAGTPPDGLGKVADIGQDGEVWGIKGKNVLRWDGTSWSTVAITFPAEFTDSFVDYEIKEIAATDSNNVVIGIELEVAQASGNTYLYRLYKLKNIAQSAPYSADIIFVKENAVSPELGYYGDLWYKDVRVDKSYRLIGGNVRSAANYISSLPGAVSGALVDLYEGEKAFSGLVSISDVTIKPTTQLELDGINIINSPIDFNDGTISLGGDLRLSSTTYMLSSGNIKGNGFAIYLGGDFVVPSGMSLRFTTSTIIDGKGHDLILGRDAQLIIDSDVVLDLRNVFLKNLQDVSKPGIVMMSPTSQLIFQNTELALAGDYTFTQGGITVLDDVVVTGTSKFIYSSTQTSTINSFSTLTFDLETTFSYVPTSAAIDLIQFSDVTSSLYLNGCIFAAPAGSFNGIVLADGRLFLDNGILFENLDGGSANSNVSKAIAFSNLDVTVLADANVVVEGYLDYDPV